MCHSLRKLCFTYAICHTLRGLLAATAATTIILGALLLRSTWLGGRAFLLLTLLGLLAASAGLGLRLLHITTAITQSCIPTISKGSYWGGLSRT